MRRRYAAEGSVDKPSGIDFLPRSCPFTTGIRAGAGDYPRAIFMECVGVGVGGMKWAETMEGRVDVEVHQRRELKNGIRRAHMSTGAGN